MLVRIRPSQLAALLVFLALSVVPVRADTTARFVSTRTIQLPGRGMALAWSADGTRLASTAGGVRVLLEENFDVAGPDTTAIVWDRQ